MRTALYPGTFDPITYGHLDIIKRATCLFERLVIGIAVNLNKAPLFDVKARVCMVEEECQQFVNNTACEIVIHPFETLLIDYARQVGAGAIVRGLRAASDFEYEFQMVGMNRMLNEEIETVFLMADVRYQTIASRLVKEIAALGGDVSRFVPPAVYTALCEKLTMDLKK